MDKELVSVIVPIYNTEAYLPRCIESLINQTYRNIEIILVVDGSPDNSIEICKKYEKKDKRVKVYNKKNSGIADTRRFGFDASHGDYIMFLDSDDWVEHDWVKYLYDLLKKYKSDIACCSYCFNDDLESLNEKIEVIDKKNIFLKYFKEPNIKTIVWNKMYKKEVLKKFKLVDEVTCNGEDVIFTCNALNNADLIVVSNQEKNHYNTLNTSITRSKITKKKIDENISAHEKQIKILSDNKYSKEIMDLAKEKLFNLIITLFINISKETEPNINEKYLIDKLKNYLRTYKNVKLKLKEKIKLYLIAYMPKLMKKHYN